MQDKDRDGLISYEEFCDKKTKTEIAFEVMSEWLQNTKFIYYDQALDTNSDGYITKTELVTASIRSGRRLSKVEVEAAFKEYDKNKVKKNILSITWWQIWFVLE